MTIDLSRRYPLLNLLSPGERKTWLDSGKEVALTVGQTLFQEGTDGLWAYVLCAGRVRILRDTKKGDVTVGLLDPIHLFGEYALVPPYKNTATCRAIDAATVVRLPLVPLREMLMAQPDIGRTIKRWLRLHSLVAFLRDQAFLGFMSADTALTFETGLVPLTYQPGQTILADDLNTDRWFYIDEGEVRLRDIAGDTLLGPGECFGEMGLLGRAGPELVIAETTVRCRTFTRQMFLPPQAAPPSVQTVTAGLRDTRAYPWIGQETFADCGIAALAMLTSALGIEVSPTDLRRTLHPGKDGLNMLEMHAAAMRFGCRPKSLWVTSDQLDRVVLPAIALLEVGHYVTLYEVTATDVMFGDPASGLTRWSRDLFQKSFSGYVLYSRRQ